MVAIDSINRTPNASDEIAHSARFPTLQSGFDLLHQHLSGMLRKTKTVDKDQDGVQQHDWRKVLVICIRNECHIAEQCGEAKRHK